MTKDKFYVVTPIYYANGSPHIGHFLTTTVADVAARFHRQKLGAENVFFTTGLDEHGTTVEQSAIKAGYTLENIQEYTDKRADEWQKAYNDTNISYDYFVRTTHPTHEKFAQDFIQKMIAKGDVYKDQYEGVYCWGCEKFLTLSDQDEKGLCPLHRPDQVEKILEDNYFFKLSDYAPKIIELIKTNKIKIIPETKKNEMLARLEAGVEDLSISRPKAKVSWGVEFPDDAEQTVYVWVEALINYLSSLEINNKQDFWAFANQTLGKDINWFHTVIWPAFLLSAGYDLFQQAFVHSFLSVSGQKISKSLGNTISPADLVAKYGIDGARYLTLANIPYKNDTDITYAALDEKYNGELANGLGNTVARLAKLAQKTNLQVQKPERPYEPEIEQFIVEFKTDQALQAIWQKLATIDKHINENEPWAITDTAKLTEVLTFEIEELIYVAYLLQPFMPTTSKKILAIFTQKADPIILFPRLS